MSFFRDLRTRFSNNSKLPIIAAASYPVDIVKLLSLFLFATLAAFASDPVKVLVWDERQPRAAKAYKNFIGNQIADYLKSTPGLEVRSTALDDPEQGLGDLESTDVLVWWGHVRHGEISEQTGQRIVEMVHSGQLALISLHSAHWSVPFMEAMNAVTRDIAKRRYPNPKTEFEFVPPEGRRPPTYDSLITPAFYAVKRGDFVTKVRVDLPNCVFPGVRNDGTPSRVTVIQPEHPIMKGIPVQFEIPQTELYDEPFHVPDPEIVLFRETWDGVGRFRGGMLWTLGKGKIFYFRPGHEEFPVFKEEHVMKILDNAVRWLGSFKKE